MSGAVLRLALSALLVGSMLPVSSVAQVAVASRGPRFLLAGAPEATVIDASSVAVLRRRVTVDLERVPLRRALQVIAAQADLELSYSERLIPARRIVSLHVRGITVAAALTEVLLDAGVDVSVTPDGQMALVKRVASASPRNVTGADSGTIVGRVTDKVTGAPLVGAAVSVDGKREEAIADEQGLYRIERLAAGSHELRARYIGYAPAVVSATVVAGSETTVDFALAKSVQVLDEVVTTGTVIPTSVRAIPTPISVITAEDIARQRPLTIQELFRQAVPTAVSFDQPNAPYYTAFAVRGASTLAGQAGQMKVFIDGIEAANISISKVNPGSIERMEVIRGPQAAAVYGSDAIGGVVQIFTKRGDHSLRRPEVTGEASVGVAETPYDGFDAVLRQQYAATLRGGTPDVSYHVGAGYSRLAAWLPNDEVSGQSNPTAYGGIRYSRGVISLDVSGRYEVQNIPIVSNPTVMQTGFLPFSKPNFQPQQYQNQTLGVRLGLTPSQYWEHRVTAGIDRQTQDRAQSLPRLRFPGDVFLEFGKVVRTKTFIGYNTSVRAEIARGIAGSITAGFDHYSLPVFGFSTTTLNTSTQIVSPTGVPPFVSSTTTNNTGYFAQAQVGFRDALFLTGGLRAEDNTNFGDSLGTPVAPRVGATYTRDLGPTTVKVRASWGQAIRAPDPTLKLGAVSTFGTRLPNFALAPERQRGWDAGADVVLPIGMSLGVTYYDQTADNLIQLVPVPDAPPATTRYENIGRVENTGLEIEAGLDLGIVHVRGQYGYARARVAALPSTYVGDLRVGDQTLLTPKHTAGAIVTVTPSAKTTVSGGITYVGSWRQYDFLAQFSCFGGTGPCQPTNRGYIIDYPSFAKVKASLSQQITPLVAGFLSVDNLANNKAYEAMNLNPIVGRVTTVGLRVQY